MLRRIVHVRREEQGALWLAFLYFFTLLSGYGLLKPVRDAMGIAGGVKALPWLFLATSALALLTVPAFSALVARWPRHRVIPVVYAFFALNLLAFWALLRAHAGGVWVARAFFVWLSVYNLFVVSVFWSFMADVFDTDQGKRLFAFVAAGGTVGTLVGSGATGLLAEPLGPTNLLLVSALLLVGSIGCVLALARWAHRREVLHPHASSPEAPVGGSAWAGLKLLLTHPYLLSLGVHTLLYTTTSTFLYFQQLRLVGGALSGTAAQAEFFGWLEFATQALTLLLQVAVSGRVLARFGLVVGLALAPLFTLLGFVSLALAPALGVLAVVVVGRRALHYALERPSREVLFTGVGREARYKSKSAIDTVVYRFGDAASAQLSGALTAMSLSIAATAAVAAPFALVWLGLAVYLARRQERRQRLVAAGAPAPESAA